MRRFAALFQALDASTATNDKVAALVAYFSAVAPTAPADAAWAVYFLAGGKPRQVLPTARLREVACQRAGVDDWLFDACYQAVGDLAETIALVMPPGARLSDQSLSVWMEERLLPMRDLEAGEQMAHINAAFDDLDAAGRFLLVKLIGGGFRVGVSKLLVQRALAAHAGLDAKLMAQRLVGWTEARASRSADPWAARWADLVAPAGSTSEAALGQPYPFFLAHALPTQPQKAPPQHGSHDLAQDLAHDPSQDPSQDLSQTLGPVSDWLVEWKYDGIRAQVVKRGSQVWIWSRGEELVTERFPEVVAPAMAWPDGTVVDGELLAWLPNSDRPAPFQLLQQRITRKNITKKVLVDAPVQLLAYDLLEDAGVDQRDVPQHTRRLRLENFAQQQGLRFSPLRLPPLRLSPLVSADTWPALALLRQQSRARGVEGLMLKQQQARYGSGRTKADGTWWKWKVDPLSVDAVLIYAQAGHGRRASLYSDFTFAVWSRPPADAAEAQAVVEAITHKEPAGSLAAGALQLLPFAKAYSGLSDAEMAAVDKVVRATTIDKFGPVRSVRPSLVFEIGFEGIGASPRHKSGVAVRFPRMLRIRHDKPLHEANALVDLQALMVTD
jgi:DNA ligase 1